MPKEQRADLHERFAGWLERTAGDRLPEYEEILAYHLEQAYRYRVELGPPDERARAIAQAAATRLLSSADRAEERGDYVTAQSLLERCAEFSEGATRAHALTVLASALSELNDFPAAMEAATQAVAAARGAGDERYALRAELVRIDARAHVDPTYPSANTRQDTESVLRRLEEIGDEDGVFRALLAVGRLDFYEGHCMKSLAVSQRLFERARGRPYRDRIAWRKGSAAPPSSVRSPWTSRWSSSSKPRSSSPGASSTTLLSDRSARGSSRCRVDPTTREPRWRGHATSGRSSATRAP